MATKEQLIQWLEESHKKIERLVAQIDSHQEIYPDWTIREILAHFTGWDDAVVASLRSHAAGGIPEVMAPRGPDFYNAATVTERETLDFDLIYREWQTTHEQLKITIQALPPEKMEASIVFPWGERGNVENLVIGLTSGHEMSHAKDIEAAMKNR
ncbi:MAG TPA: hypothetical protein DEH25_09025 [Chloroflexi bacterium]|nr:hypothetical protein [Chloroflexota bacterium]HBY07394.1 hypothetical protein [Chloroflexota bacterium]